MRNPSRFLKFPLLLFLFGLQFFFISDVYATKAAGLAFVETASPQDMTAGDKQDLVYVIKNTGTAATKLVINGFLPPMVRDNTVPNNCGDTLAPGAMCYIKLTTTPTDEMAFKQMLLINNGALTAPLNFVVHALKIVYKDSVATVNAFPYEKQDGKVTLQNSSKSNVLTGINAVVHAPAGLQFKITSTTCGAPLVPGASCVYNYTYQAPPESQVTEEYTRSNVDFDITYTNASASFTLEYPIQVLQFKYGHFVNLPVDLTGFNEIPSNDIYTVMVRGNTIYATSWLGLSSSKDYGNSWTHYTVTQGFQPNMYWPGKVFVSGDGKRIYVAGYGVKVSNDSGKTWTCYDTSTGLSSNYDYYAFANEDGSRIYVATVNGLDVSADAGKTWKNYSEAQGLIYHQVQSVYASADGQKIYAGTSRGLSISTDAGKTWKNYTTSEGLINNYIARVFANRDGSKIYAATISGFSISRDSGISWENISANDAQAISASDDDTRIYAIDRNKISISLDGGKTWNYYNFPSQNSERGMDIFANPDGSKIYATTMSSLTNSAQDQGGLLVSSDNGTTWTRFATKTGLKDIYVKNLYVKGSNIYAAAMHTFSISNDGGRTWKDNNPIQVSGNYLYFSDVRLSPDESNIYLSSEWYYGGLSVSKDRGKTWKNYTTLQGLGSDIIDRTYVTPNGSKMYAATWQDKSTGMVGGLSVSTDGGNSWKNYTTAQGLNCNDISSVYASDDGTKIYAGTLYYSLNHAANDKCGVSISTDSGKTWKNYTTDQGLINNDVQDIYVSRDGSKIYAATLGGLSGSFDGGATWKTLLAKDGNKIRAVFANNDGATIYALADCGDLINSRDTELTGLYVSNDSGLNWKKYGIKQGLLLGNMAQGVVATSDNSKVYVAEWAGGIAFTYLKKPTVK